MLDHIKAILKTYKTEHAFRKLVLRRFAPHTHGRALVLRALKTASKAHSATLRLEGELVLSQPIAVAVLLSEVLEERDPNLIAAALLHLFVEDVRGWSKRRLGRVFNPTVAAYVDFVTKEDGEDNEHSWNERTNRSHEKLLQAPLSVQKMKLCDRLSNLLSITFLPVWKEERMLRDTVDFYVPLSKKLGVLEEVLLEAVKYASRVNAS